MGVKGNDTFGRALGTPLPPIVSGAEDVVPKALGEKSHAILFVKSADGLFIKLKPSLGDFGAGGEHITGVEPAIAIGNGDEFLAFR